MSNYTRYPFLALPYSMKHMAMPKELMIDYDSGVAYVRSDDGIRDIPLNAGLLDNHINDYDNPHNVTKEQIGLENVENFSIATVDDMIDGVNDKYVTPAMVSFYIEYLDNEGFFDQGSGVNMFKVYFEVDPETATVEVYYNNKWNKGLIHTLPNGDYQYRAYLEEYIEEYPVNITTIPENATVEVKINNEWVKGKHHMLPNGEYEYRAYVED